jgi:hypothetical protein
LERKVDILEKARVSEGKKSKKALTDLENTNIALAARMEYMEVIGNSD